MNKYSHKSLSSKNFAQDQYEQLKARENLIEPNFQTYSNHTQNKLVWGLKQAAKTFKVIGLNFIYITTLLSTMNGNLSKISAVVLSWIILCLYDAVLLILSAMISFLAASSIVLLVTCLYAY